MAKSSGMPAIRACLFDMDGLLIDSEDIYTLCTNSVLRDFGKPELPWSIKAQLQGRPGPEAGKIFQKWAQLPITSQEIIARTRDYQIKHFPDSKPLPGVEKLLSTLSRANDSKLYLALATSSQKGNFELKTRNNQKVFSVFLEEHRILGDDPRIPAGRGKPAPDIYLLALKTINETLKRKGLGDEIQPSECLVFEDSVPGVEAGRRAGMQVVWCPHPGLLNEYKGREKEVLAGLTGEYKDEISPQVDTANQTVTGQPGEIDDGWATLLHTLEDFPYARYGLQV